MSGIRAVLIFTAISAVFLVPHFVAGIYAAPKPPPADCAKPGALPSS